ncbi:zinc-binding dehydrogenase [Rhodococcus baikonurensis]|uniref:zinc-binding dehydrogenase n=1 Tax=Rhodococcus baikonurensis TaxID=172041 RepID=UPI003798D354
MLSKTSQRSLPENESWCQALQERSGPSHPNSRREPAQPNVTGIVSSNSKAQRLPTGVQPVVGVGDTLVSQLSSLPKFDVLIDTVGGPNLAGLLDRVRPGGRAALVGYTHGSNVTLHLPNFLMSDVKILPVNMIRRAEEQAALAPLMSEKIVSGEIVSPVQEFPLSQVSVALDALASGQLTGRAVLIP